MLIPPESLLDGCVRTLLEAVLPGVESRFARGQLYAVADVLRNLRDRVEEKSAIADGEASSARAALARAGEALAQHAGGAALAETITRALGEASGLPPREAAARLREAVARAGSALHALPEDVAAPARAALGGHLAAQAVRDVLLLKPSLLREISKG